MLCPECKAQLPDGSQVCDACGALLVAEEGALSGKHSKKGPDRTDPDVGETRATWGRHSRDSEVEELLDSIKAGIALDGAEGEQDRSSDEGLEGADLTEARHAHEQELPAEGEAVAPVPDGRHASPRRTSRKVPLVLVLCVIVLAAVCAYTRCFGLLGVGTKGTVEGYSWKQLSQISSQISAAGSDEDALAIAARYHLVNDEGKLDGTQTKKVKLSGGLESTVMIVGFNHDDKADGTGKAGISFMFCDAIDAHAMNVDASNKGGWESSEMRSWLAGDAKSKLPHALSSRLVAVEKRTNNTGPTTDASAVTATADELWLLSFKEIAGDVKLEDGLTSNPDLAAWCAVWNQEGKQYKLFSDVGIQQFGANGLLSCKSLVDGGKCSKDRLCYWWERSSTPYTAEKFLGAGIDGDPIYSDNANAAYGVICGFCL